MSRNESIYKLIPKETPPIIKPAMHVSKYYGKAPPSCSTFGRSTGCCIMTTNVAGEYDPQDPSHKYVEGQGTFGPTKTERLLKKNPTRYLKKGEKNIQLPTPQKFAYKPYVKPKLDTVNTRPPPHTREKVNFIIDNAVKAIMSMPIKMVTKKDNPLTRPDYGKPPKYLEQVKEQVRLEKEYVRSMIEQKKKITEEKKMKTRLMGKDERDQLLVDLKIKWQDVNEKYQGMTHLVRLDTIGKVRRKEQHENELAMLERSIEKLSKQNVFIQDSV